MPHSFGIFINVFAFLLVNENSKEICQEILFPSSLRKMLLTGKGFKALLNYDHSSTISKFANWYVADTK